MILQQPELFAVCKRQLGKELKAAGMERVLERTDGEWKSMATECVRKTAEINMQFTFDNVRDMAAATGLHDPHSCNAWGAIMRVAAAMGIAAKTDRYVSSANPVSHGRMIAIWESRIFKKEAA